MTVEPQLCPQCGSPIRFEEEQTEVVCPYCGTTVVKSTDVASLKKEIEGEKLGQEIVEREERLFSKGQLATAKILTAQMTDIFRNGLNGKGVLMSFTVEVRPDKEAPFNAEAKAFVGLVAIDKYEPGTVLDVRYDPQDHTQVSVAGRHGVPGSDPEEELRQMAAQLNNTPSDTKDDVSDTENDGSVKAWTRLWKAQSEAARISTPAWGKPLAAGTVLVPAQFDPVNNLGKPIAVYRREGTMLFAALSRTKPKELVLYQDGLAFHTGDKEIHTWRWPEVAAILTNLRILRREYTLLKGNGEKLILDDNSSGGFAEADKLIERIKPAVYALLYPPMAQHYNTGQAVTFGPVTVHSTNGLEMGSKTYAWANIIEVKVDRGRLTVTMRDDRKHEVRTCEIPNVELLGRLIGVKIDSTQLDEY